MKEIDVEKLAKLCDERIRLTHSIAEKMVNGSYDARFATALYAVAEEVRGSNGSSENGGIDPVITMMMMNGGNPNSRTLVMMEIARRNPNVSEDVLLILSIESSVDRDNAIKRFLRSRGVFV